MINGYTLAPVAGFRPAATMTFVSSEERLFPGQLLDCSAHTQLAYEMATASEICLSHMN
jgi:hypothetical protein